jgi:hypothetical protein
MLFPLLEKSTDVGHGFVCLECFIVLVQLVEHPDGGRVDLLVGHVPDRSRLRRADRLEGFGRQVVEGPLVSRA